MREGMGGDFLSLVKGGNLGLVKEKGILASLASE
jgi:hypothetical protein